MYYNTPFPHNVFSIVKIACSIGEKLSRVFISLLVYCSLAIYASEARFIAHSHRASEERLLARVRRARLARIRASETRFIARSQYMRAKRDLLLARVRRDEILFECEPFVAV